MYSKPTQAVNRVSLSTEGSSPESAIDAFLPAYRKTSPNPRILDNLPVHEKTCASTKIWKNEVRMLQELQGEERVVRYFGSDKQSRSIRMERVIGINLHDYCDDHCLSSIEAARCISGCAAIINFMHEKDLVHRDVSLTNFMLEEGTILALDTPDHIRAIDFGHAYDLNHAKTERGTKPDSCAEIGTPYYWAPEKLEGYLEFGKSSDVFALGVMWYRMVEGAFPFDPGYGNLKRQIMLCEPVPPEKVNASTSELIMMCLSKDYTNRPTASDIYNYCAAVL